MSDDVYTFDLSMQKKIVALLFQDFTYLSTVGVELIKPSYFDDLYLRNICKWIIRYYEEFHTKPTETVLINEFNKFSEHSTLSLAEQDTFMESIRELSTIVIDDVQYIKEEALDFARQVALRDAVFKMADLVEKGSNYDEAVNILDEALSVGAGTHLGLSLSDSIDNMPALLKESYDMSNMFTTGIPTLDDAFGGGMAKGELYVCCGSPGKGKSKFLSYLAYQAIYQKRPVVYFSFEWSEKEVLSNIITCSTGLSMRDIMDPEKEEMYHQRVKKLKAWAPNVRTVYYSNKTVNANNLRTYLTKLESLENFKPGLIIIDYADLMLPIKQTKRSSESTYEEMGTIFYDLKALADTFECPVITGSQLGKSAWNQQDEEVSTQDQLADSSRKAHVAYGIVTLNQTKEELAANKMRLFVAKARRGKTGTTVYIDFDKGRNQIHECNEYKVKELKPAE